MSCRSLLRVATQPLLVSVRRLSTKAVRVSGTRPRVLHNGGRFLKPIASSSLRTVVRANLLGNTDGKCERDLYNIHSTFGPRAYESAVKFHFQGKLTVDELINCLNGLIARLSGLQCTIGESLTKEEYTFAKEMIAYAKSFDYDANVHSEQYGNMAEQRKQAMLKNIKALASVIKEKQYTAIRLAHTDEKQYYD